MPRFDFDPNDYKEEANRFTPVPKGEYKLKAVESEEFDTRAGDGTYIKVKFKIVDGKYDGRVIFNNFNTNNPSDDAQRIGRGQIYAWRVACGKPDADDTDQLIEVPFFGYVDIEPGKPGYSDQNRIRRFFDPNEAVNRASAQGAYQEAKPGDGGGKVQGELPGTERPRSEPRPARPASTGEKKPWIDDDIPFIWTVITLGSILWTMKSGALSLAFLV